MNASIQIELVRLDASSQIPLNAYDDKGNPTGPNEEFLKDMKEADGKSVIRANCTCNGKQTGFVSQWFDWNDEKMRSAIVGSLLSTISHSLSTHRPWEPTSQND